MTYTPPTPKTWHNDPASGIDPMGTDTPLDSLGLGDLEARMIAGMVDLSTHLNTILVSVKSFGALGDGNANDTTAINNAIASLGTVGGTVFFPAGTYRVASTIIVPGGVTLQGVGIDYAGVSVEPARGSIIKGVTAGMGVVVQLGDVLADNNIGSGAYNSAHTAPRMMDMVVTGNNSVSVTVKVIAARWAIDRCQIWRAATCGLWVTGQNGYCRSSIIGQNSLGSCIISEGNDNKFHGNQIREGLVNQIKSTGTFVEICHNHIFGNSSTTGSDIELQDGGGVMGEALIMGNVIGDREASAPIKIVASAVSYPRDILITGNQFYRDSPANKTVPVVLLDTTLGALYNVAIVNNSISCISVSAGNGYKSIVDLTGGNVVNNLALIGNTASSTEHIATNVTPDVRSGNSTRWYDGATTKIYRDAQSGQSTFSGNAVTTAFTINHTLDGTPGDVEVTPASSDAAVLHYVSSVTATTIVVTFKTAPASGTNNVKLNWRTAL